jgi:hypothetical protein
MNEKGQFVIVPIIDCAYYETEEGACGIRFPMGIEAGELFDLLEDSMQKIENSIGKKNKKRKGERSLSSR